MADYPEHNRLRAIADKSQLLGEFMEWLQTDERVPGGPVCFARCDEYDNYFSVHMPIEKTLAAFFEIDLRKIEDEKMAMLDELRSANAVRVEA